MVYGRKGGLNMFYKLVFATIFHVTSLKTIKMTEILIKLSDCCIAVRVVNRRTLKGILERRLPTQTFLGNH